MLEGGRKGGREGGDLIEGGAPSEEFEAHADVPDCATDDHLGPAWECDRRPSIQKISITIRH